MGKERRENYLGAEHESLRFESTQAEGRRSFVDLFETDGFPGLDAWYTWAVAVIEVAAAVIEVAALHQSHLG
mgnify:CR=1 FL=1